MILKNHAIAPIKKERRSPMSKTKKASRNQFVEKGSVPDRVQSLREVNRSENRPRAWPGFIKSIRNGLRNDQNLI